MKPETDSAAPPDDFESLKPSQRFARLAKKVFSVDKRTMDEHLKEHPLPKLKPGPKPRQPTA
jgi:hypothetical protein